MQSPFTVLFAATRLKQLLRNDAARFVAAHDAVQVCVSVCRVKQSAVESGGFAGSGKQRAGGLRAMESRELVGCGQ
jgi:hypothetical protein